MCLDVHKSHVRKPIGEVECFKILQYEGDGKWATPYQYSTVVEGTGWFMPHKPAKRQVREYRKNEIIEGGYIHAYTTPNKGIFAFSVYDGVFDELPSKKILKVDHHYRFRCIARDVVAVGDMWDQDLVCRALYIPAFDITGEHRHAILDMTR